MNELTYLKDTNPEVKDAIDFASARGYTLDAYTFGKGWITLNIALNGDTWHRKSQVRCHHDKFVVATSSSDWSVEEANQMIKEVQESIEIAEVLNRAFGPVVAKIHEEAKEEAQRRIVEAEANMKAINASPKTKTFAIFPGGTEIYFERSEASINPNRRESVIRYVRTNLKRKDGRIEDFTPSKYLGAGQRVLRAKFEKDFEYFKENNPTDFEMIKGLLLNIYQAEQAYRKELDEMK